MRRYLPLLVLIACGDNTADTGGARSGSRLKLVWYEYSDGTRQLERGWYFDDERGERCTPVRWSDGSRYCTPDAGDAVYVDDTCATALGRVPSGTSPAPYFVRYYHVRGEPFPSRVARLGAVTTAPQNVWELRDGNCSGPATVDSGYDYYSLGEVLTSEAFVKVKRSEPVGDDRLALVFDTSDDGLRVAAAIFDREVRQDCVIDDRAGAKAIECVAGDSVIAGYFHDPECTQLEIVTTELEIPPRSRHYSPQTSCWSYYTIGSSTSAPPLYQRAGNSCQEILDPGNARFFLAGEMVEMPVLERQVEPTERRLARIDRVHGTLRIDDPLLRDTELATDCERRDDGGDIRCVPATTVQVVPVFADVGCQTIVDVALVPSGTCDPPASFATKGAAFHPVLDAYTMPVYELTTGEQCREYTPPVPMVIHAIGGPVAPSEFVTAQRVL
ncbi:MAG: hypothetical protein AB7O24_29385 [Kofleriaceae bacterium]